MAYNFTGRADGIFDGLERGENRRDAKAAAARAALEKTKD